VKRAWLLLALLLVGCGGTLVERVNSAIDTGCTICDTLSPLCSARAKPTPPVTVNVILPSTAPVAPSVTPSASGSAAP
jgi:hypothetical protein